MDAVLELQGECNIIEDYTTCDSVATDSTSAAASVVPGIGALWAVVAGGLVLAAAGLA